VQSAQLLSVAIGPVAGGYVATHFGIRYAFYVTAIMCGIALVALAMMFQETRPLDPGERRGPARSTPLRDFVRYPHFLGVMLLLLIAQFIDRGLALMIPLQVAHLPGIEAIAATSGLIISVAAVGAAISAQVVARLSEAMPVGRLLLIQFAVGGAACGAMALATSWPALLILRTVAALCLGGALTLAYSLGGLIVPAETRGAAFGWLALGVQIGTAASPLLTGALAAVSLPSAYLMDAVMAWVGAVVLLFAMRDLVTRRAPRHP
jgi:DHA1 family multidrug resistance protein-like MFS transporter